MEAGKVVKIVVATHKQYRMPEDEMYVPLHVGAQGKKDENGNELELGYIKDNTGDHISERNPGFCELTGLYWAWKNLDADYIGLAHYRRHFCNKRSGDPFDRVLTYQDIEPYLGKVKLFLPKKRKYYIESLYSHYAHTHYIVQLDETRAIIEEKYPDYLESYDKSVHRTSGYMFNMMIMQRDLLDEYCTWLFDILFELEARIAAGKLEMPELSPFQGRFYGRVSEIIFNVWLDYRMNGGGEDGGLHRDEIREIPYVFMEKINWSEKYAAFLQAKFLGKKYEVPLPAKPEEAEPKDAEETASEQETLPDEALPDENPADDADSQ